MFTDEVAAIPAESLSDQCERLVQILQMTPLEIVQREQICNDIKACLSAEFPNCGAYVFGSSCNTLGFKNSDVDLFLSVGEEWRHWINEGEIVFKFLSLILPPPGKKLLFTICVC